MDPLNYLLLGLMGAMIIIVIYYLIKLLRADPTQCEVLRPKKTIVKVDQQDEDEEEPLLAE
jgi:hypothetical protein